MGQYEEAFNNSIFTNDMYIYMFFCLFRDAEDNSFTFITSIPIYDVTDKFIDDKCFLTVELDNCIVEEYGLAYNELSVPVSLDIYNQITVNEGYAGVTLKVFVPKGHPKTEIGIVLKEKNMQDCEIISVTTKKNIVISDEVSITSNKD